jgi:DNA primase
VSGRIPKHFIDDLINRVDIVDLIDRHVPLKKTGSNFVARCPFHTEKTPSFSVNRTKQFFHCFGCGASGNVIGFLMDFNHLDFVEAVEDLAAFAGIEVPREDQVDFIKSAEKTNSIENTYQLLDKVTSIYQHLLNASDANKGSKYLASRGISKEITELFCLGYAPNEWRTLTNQFDNNTLSQAGLSVTNNGSTYDRFRDRIMFPIRDKRGRVIGFGGRVLDDSLPKYLNSPETSLFHKNKEVYGLHELLSRNSKPDRILIVEGYMDVIALACHGIHNAVATLGTATSQTHMDLLFRFSSELVFCFDGDNAGQKAAWRAISAVFPSLKDGRIIRIMLLPENHDPDSLVNQEGTERFLVRVNNSQALSDYFFKHLAKDLKLAEFENRATLRAEAETYLKQLPIGSFRELMFNELSRLYKIHVHDHEALQAYKQKIRIHRENTDRLSLPSFLMALMIQHPLLINIIEQQNLNWDYLDFDGKDKFIEILTRLLTLKPPNYGVLLEHFRYHKDETIIKKLASYDFLIPEEGLKNEFSGALHKLFKQASLSRLEKLLAKEKIEGLTANEKIQLRDLLTAQHTAVTNKQL